MNTELKIKYLEISQEIAQILGKLLALTNEGNSNKTISLEEGEILVQASEKLLLSQGNIHKAVK